MKQLLRCRIGHPFFEELQWKDGGVNNDFLIGEVKMNAAKKLSKMKERRPIRWRNIWSQTSGNIFGRMLASSIDALSICLAYYDKQHSPEVGLESIVCTQNTMLQ